MLKMVEINLFIIAGFCVLEYYRSDGKIAGVWSLNSILVSLEAKVQILS